MHFGSQTCRLQFQLSGGVENFNVNVNAANKTRSMRCLCLVACLAVGCDCFAVRSSKLIMRSKKAVTRRDIAKQFYDPDGWRKGLPPGWSPALVVALSATAASYGGSARQKVLDEIKEFTGGAKDQQGEFRPNIVLTPGRKLGLVNVEITVAASPPDVIDYIWLSDAETGEILSGRRVSPKDRTKLAVVVDRGRRIVPSAHCARSGVTGGVTWEGEAVMANAS